MRAPVVAMLWEWWRLTRRPLLFFSILSLASGWALLARMAGHTDTRPAFVAFVLALALAPVAGMAVWAKHPAAGYPLPLMFARPVPTWLLVAVPMCYLAIGSAATYALPAIVFRFVLGAPFPLVPVTVLVAASMGVFCACQWATRHKVLRFLVTMVLLANLGSSLRWMSPGNAAARASFPPPLRTDIVPLTWTDYALILLVVGAAFVATVWGVERQRHGESERRGRSMLVESAGAVRKGIVEHFRDVADAVIRFPCPTSSPLAAELWIETESRGIPVIAIGLLFALGIPVVFLVSKAGHWQGPAAFVVIAILALVLTFFASISVSFWNRASSLRSPMSAFEATRPIATARLVAVQVGVAVSSILAAWALVVASFRLSQPLNPDSGLAPLWSALASSLGGWSGTRLAATAALMVVALTTVVALLATVRAFSVLYGLRLWLGALATVLYLVVFVFLVATDHWSFAVVGAHFWVVAVAVPLATAFVMVRALADRILRPAQVLTMIIAWLAFALVGVFVAREAGFGLAALAPAIAALTLSAALLPLTASVLTPWSYGLMRHA
jgi:hypothetical protein